MNRKFRKRFEEGMKAIAASLTKKSGTKKYEAVMKRIGKLEGRYPSIARYYSITVEKDEKEKATSVTWAVEMPDEEVFGTYFLRTNVKTLDEKGGVREIEYLMEGTPPGTTTTSSIINIRVMAQWQKTQIKRENGETVDAQAPIIVSASRSTDIPAFYADWFFHRFKVGYSAWTNPFNGVKGYVSYKNTRFIVFWSKNPHPLLTHLDYLKERNIGCYIQYTLNDYEQEGLEQGVPKLDERIDTFKRLVEKLGKGHVIWRFDPLMLTDDITIDTLLAKIENIGDQLQGYTEKLVFSFADIAAYRKVKVNLEKSHIPYHEWTEPQMLEFAQHLSNLNKKWGYTLATCGEKINLQQFGIEHNHCIDDTLIIRFAYNDKALTDFLKVKTFPIPAPNLFGESQPLPSDAIILPNNTYATHGDNRDKGQRQFCGCIVSKDIGEYNTCPHLCEYCYANASKEAAQRNYESHKANPQYETITCDIPNNISE